MADNSDPSAMTAASKASVYEIDGAALGLEVGTTVGAAVGDTVDAALGDTVDPAVAVASDI